MISRRSFLQGALALSVSRPASPLYSTPLPEDEDPYPAYLNLHREGVLTERAHTLKEHYRNCRLCPRDCRVDRTAGQTGKCEASDVVKVSSAFPHFGEEPELVGRKGSGTIFFSHCGLRCAYCQNYEISILGGGREISDRRLAESMLKMQAMGCHNINLVTPTHFLPGILAALDMAASRGLRIPLVYNTSGFEYPEVLKLLDGIVDIYLPDFKYSNPSAAARYSSEAYSYPYYAKMALKEMFRQVGNLTKLPGRIARRGLMIRHLVLPHRAAGTKEILKFVAEEISKDCYINIMRQYRPEHNAGDFPKLSRRLIASEYAEALQWARELGLTRLAR